MNSESMSISEYQKLAARTINHDLDIRSLVDHALLGLGSEAGEVMGLFQKVYQGHPRDEEKTMKEMGDVMWFLAELATALGYSLEEIAVRNIEKLVGRYPDGFESERSVNRDKYSAGE